MDRLPRIYLLEDDDFQRETLAAWLHDQALPVEQARDVASFQALLAQGLPDVAILDRGLPDGDGFDVAATLRDEHPLCGIIILTAADDIIDRVIGLESGADDYLTKPFEPRELLARLRAQIRRAQAAAAPRAPAPPSGLIRLHDGVLDPARGSITRDDGQTEELSAAERETLALLLRHAGQPVARHLLAGADGGISGDRAADLRVMRLRRRLEKDAARPELIRTVRGRGYALVSG